MIQWLYVFSCKLIKIKILDIQKRLVTSVELSGEKMLITENLNVIILEVKFSGRRQIYQLGIFL